MIMKRLFATLIAGIAFAASSHAVVLDWTNAAVVWTAGAQTGSFDVDATNPGNDITVTTALVGSATYAASSPQNIVNDGSTIGSDDAKRLHIRTSAGFVNTTSGISITINFNYAAGVTNVSFSLIDVDATTTTWIDRFSAITATPVTGPANSVALTATATSPPNITIQNNGTTSLVFFGNTATGNITDHTGDVTLTTGATPITSLTLFWNNPGPNFGGQVIGLSNISFTPVPVPEVGSSLGSLAICGGVAVLWRRRRPVAAIAQA